MPALRKERLVGELCRKDKGQKNFWGTALRAGESPHVGLGFSRCNFASLLSVSRPSASRRSLSRSLARSLARSLHLTRILCFLGSRAVPSFNSSLVPSHRTPALLPEVIYFPSSFLRRKYQIRSFFLLSSPPFVFFFFFFFSSDARSLYSERANCFPRRLKISSRIFEKL